MSYREHSRLTRRIAELLDLDTDRPVRRADDESRTVMPTRGRRSDWVTTLCVIALVLGLINLAWQVWELVWQVWG